MSEGSSGAVEVTYRLSDLYAVTLQSWRWHLRWVLAIPAFLLVALVIIPVATVGQSIADAIANVPWELVLGFAGFLLLMRIGVSPLTGYLDARRDRELGPTSFELTDTGVRVQTRDGQSLVYWSAVKRVQATRDRLFLFTDRASGFVLPRRAFDDGNAFEVAVGKAITHWLAART